MSFKSFWGNINVPEESVKSVDKGDEEAKETKSGKTESEEITELSGDVKIKTDEFELQTGSSKPKKEDKQEDLEDLEDPKGSENGDEEEDKSKKGNSKPGDDHEEEEEGEEGYEFSEEDISKAFTMLEEEGVIEIGEDDEFEATTKGLGDVIAATVRNKVNATLNSLPEEVIELYKYIQNGGVASEFVPSKDVLIADLDISEDEAKHTVLKKFYLNQGLTEEEAESEIEDLEVLGKIDAKAETAHKALIRLEEKEISAREKERIKKEQADAKAREEELIAIKKEIDSLDELAGFKLDEDKKEAFKDYLFKVNPRTNMTQMQENMNNEERRMTLAFLDFVNYTKADLDKEVSTKLTKIRKKKLTKYTDKGTKTKNSSVSVSKQKKNTGKIVFPSIFGKQTIEVED